MDVTPYVCMYGSKVGRMSWIVQNMRDQEASVCSGSAETRPSDGAQCMEASEGTMQNEGEGKSQGVSGAQNEKAGAAVGEHQEEEEDEDGERERKRMRV